MKRTEAEMLTLIQKFAQKHPEILAIGTEGSRNNPAISSDEFQDFDVTFFVSYPSQLVKFRKLDYEKEFGEIAITSSPTGEFSNDYGITKLMQFTDGNRIDLKVLLLAQLDDYLKEDSLNKIIWGAEERETNDATWRVKSPTKEELEECINEFYWVSTYVAKGIRRKNLIYANATFEFIREEYFRFLSFRYFVGKNPGKFFSNVAEVASVEKFYRLGTLEETKQALIQLLKAFKKELVELPEYVEKTEIYIFYLLESV